MNTREYFWNLPPASINVLSTGFVFLVVCLGIRIVRSPEVALQAASVRLNVSSSANKLKSASEELEEQARLIEAKDKAYEELLVIYQDSLQGQKRYRKLQRAIEDIQELPNVEEIEEVTQKVRQVEEDINLITVE